MGSLRAPLGGLGLLLAASAAAGPDTTLVREALPRRLVRERSDAREQKRQRMAARRLQRRAERPPVLGEPVLRPQALGCDPPCDRGTLVAEAPFYDVLVDCATGAFGVRTGVSHPATAEAGGVKQDVLFDAAVSNAAAGGRVSLFAHEDGSLLEPVTEPSACVFDPPDSAAEPGRRGIEQEWLVRPRPGVDLLVRHELVAFGSSPANAGVRLTLRVENMAASDSVTLGLRWWLDPALALDDGPAVSALTCEPRQVRATWTEEHELGPSEIDEHLLVRNDDFFGDEPAFEHALSTSPLADFAGTFTPDRIVVARWANAPDVPAPPWDYAAVEGDPASDDVVLMLYSGSEEATATVLGPGETLTRSLVLLSECDGEGASCVAPAFTARVDGVPACPGEPVTLWASLESPGFGDYTYSWTFGDGSAPVRVTDPTVTIEHVYAGPDVYRPRLVASGESEPGCSSFSAVDVAVELGESPEGALADELRVRRSGGDVVLEWLGSAVMPASFAVASRDSLAGVPGRSDFPRGGAVVRWALEETLTDSTASGVPLRHYLVYPADTECGFPVVPPELEGWEDLVVDDFEADSGWIVDPDRTDDATTGIWERADPHGTSFQPEDDHTPDPGVLAWVTGNGLPDAGDGADDVDDGCTTLQSPVHDVAGRAAIRVSYFRAWNIGAAEDDALLVEISNDGGDTWQVLEVVETSTGGYVEARHVLDEDVLGGPPDRIVVRFTACDLEQLSFVEAALDDFTLSARR